MQYSGPNKDCPLTNNSNPSERRVLAAPATSPAGSSYFVASLSVADRFSEFHLTVSSPLTVAAVDLVGRQLFTKPYAGSPGGVRTLEAARLGAFRGVLLLTVTTAHGTATRRVVRE